MKNKIYAILKNVGYVLILIVFWGGIIALIIPFHKKKKKEISPREYQDRDTVPFKDSFYILSIKLEKVYHDSD